MSALPPENETPESTTGEITDFATDHFSALAEALDLSSEILSTDIADVELLVRTYNALLNGGIKTIGDLVRYSPADLLKFQNFGRRSLRDVQEKLKDLNLAPKTAMALDSTKAKALTFEDIPRDLMAKLAMKLGDFELSVRVRHCIHDPQIKYIGDLVQETPYSLLRRKNFGKTSLGEVANLLADLELSLGTVVKNWDHANVEDWRRQNDGAVKKQFDELYAWHPKSDGNSTAASRDAPSMVAQAEFRPALYLEDELRDAARMVTADENLSMLISLWGWSGKGARTLQSVGKDTSVTGRSVGVSRERVRQIAASASSRLQKKEVPKTLLDRALKHIEQMLPASEHAVSQALQQAGITRGPFDPSGIFEAAKLLSCVANFSIQDLGASTRLVWPTGPLDSALRLFMSKLSRLSSSQGCVNFEDLLERCGLGEESGRASARRLIEELEQVVWLGTKKEWLTDLSVARSRLTNNIRKVFSVTEKVHLGELRTAIGRHHRVETRPPHDVLKAFCAQLSFLRVDRDWVETNTGQVLRSTLRTLEATIVRVLQRNGGVMARADLEEACLAAGMNRSSFYVMLGYSPVITRFVRGVYGVVGARVPAGVVDELQPKYGPGVRRRVDDGWTLDGHPWFAVELSGAMIQNGVLGVPSGHKDRLQGDWTLIDNSADIVGRLTIRDSNLRNAATPLHRLGAEMNDIAAFVFSLTDRTVQLRLGTDELIERLQGDAEQD